jgi:hypothetical protein
MLAKTIRTITITASLAVLMLAMTASTFLAAPGAAASSHQYSVVKSEQHVVMQNDNYNSNGKYDTNTHQVNSLSVTQSGGNRPKVECEGNWVCEIIGNTVVASSHEDNNDNNVNAASITTSAAASGTTTALTQSNIQLYKDGSSDNDNINTVNQGNVATSLASTIIGRLFSSHIMIHWSWLGG